MAAIIWQVGTTALASEVPNHSPGEVAEIHNLASIPLCLCNTIEGGSILVHSILWRIRRRPSSTFRLAVLAYPHRHGFRESAQAHVPRQLNVLAPAAGDYNGLQMLPVIE